MRGGRDRAGRSYRYVGARLEVVLSMVGARGKG